MNETASLHLPLIQPSQAQKHVTVNEALARLDGLAQICLRSRSVATPPALVDGDCFAVPVGAVGDWSGQDGKVAVASNGGWIFVQPLTGWLAWIVDEHVRAVWLQGAWQAGVIAVGGSGAMSRFLVAEADHVLTGDTEQLVDIVIPANSVIFACSAMIVEDITGSLSNWTFDVESGSVTFGTGMGLLAGSYCTGVLSQPTTIYTAQRPRLRPEGGDFAGGRLRIAAHFYLIDLPG